MKKFLAVFALFVFAACGSGDHNAAVTDSTEHTDGGTNTAASSSAMKAMHDAMNSMMEDIKGMQTLGDADHDFAMMMRRHHQGAVAMAEAELSGGADDIMKEKARKTIAEQSKDIEAFTNFLQQGGEGKKSDFGERAKSMMTPMSNIQMDGSSIDAMFAGMMIPHHEDGIKMAQAFLKEGKDAGLKKIAQAMIDNHPKEVEELRQWIKAGQ